MEMPSTDPVIQAEFMDANSLKAIANNDAISREQKMVEVGRQFEGVLLKTFLEDALKPMIEGAIDEDSTAHGIYRHFLTDMLADNISKSQSFGFSSALQAQVQGGTPSKSVDVSSPTNKQPDSI